MVTSTNCPNCGAPIKTDKYLYCGAPIKTDKCLYCGTTFIDFACISEDDPFFMKIRHGGTTHIVRARLSSICMGPPDTILYADNRPFYSNCSILNMSFEVLNAGEPINKYYNVSS